MARGSPLSTGQPNLGHPRPLTMQLLLVAEQTALLQKVTSQYQPTLEPLITEQGRVAITPVLTVTPPQPAPQRSQNQYYGNAQPPTTTTTTLSLSLGCSVEPAEPVLVHCKLVVSDRRSIQTKDSKPPQTKEVEARAILQTGLTNVSSVGTLSFDHPFEKVTILFRVYDIVDGRPASGLIQRLNRARLEGSRSCDVKLVVDGVELDAHRAVLAERSPVLNRISQNQTTNKERISDFSNTRTKKGLNVITFLTNPHGKDSKSTSHWCG
ncbi:uncharacterized protein LOC127751715 [Frankliniella occidentalis]|uniref:Uncharacterized protein LOC127751715 n=1 Tax=Frankliniella occidentalis TaxID=133901 RepID=A0A9C6XV18_FRAOC|nr:uncharacterized protein LOC127751715 [Frankliniella occidentalis]